MSVFVLFVRLHWVRKAFNHRKNHSTGFTLVELLTVMAAVAILVAIAVPSYKSIMEKKNLSKVIEDLNQIATAVEQKYYSADSYPASLAEIGLGGMKDPWGRAYYYVNLKDPANQNLARKNGSLQPVNSDFDLYSAGADGETAASFSNSISEDDIVRANSGGYFGFVKDY